ncbi:hypothetical protein FRC09_000058 [Ceratobasidium sp. 395]|nr:hypothetical protein FRC09_000058 [Ceratobasidium sp. 395]
MVVRWFAVFSSITDLTDELSDPSTVIPFAVARGGLSDVYRATRWDGSQIAIKCLRQHDPKHCKRTARELYTWSKLSHQNVLELRGLAVFQDCLAMVSPWMEHGSVNLVLDKWPDKSRYMLCQQLTAAIDYLHEEGVANVLMAQDGTLKLTDFGLAIMHNAVIQFTQTDPGGGTCRWMAPELYTENPQRTREADVYAMGMEIITGDVPFREIQSGHMIGFAVVNQRRTPDVSELDTGSLEAMLMLAILQACWKYEPKDRPTARKVALVVSPGNSPV